MSRTLNVTYLKPVPVGETCIIECEVVSIGKRLGEFSRTGGDEGTRMGKGERS